MPKPRRGKRRLGVLPQHRRQLRSHPPLSMQSYLPVGNGDCMPIPIAVGMSVAISIGMAISIAMPIPLGMTVPMAIPVARTGVGDAQTPNRHLIAILAMPNEKLRHHIKADHQ